MPTSRSTHCEGRRETPLFSVRLPQRLGALPVLTSQSALRLSITESPHPKGSGRVVPYPDHPHRFLFAATHLYAPPQHVVCLQCFAPEGESDPGPIGQH